MGHSVQDLEQREIPNLPSGKKIQTLLVGSIPNREPKVSRNYASELHNLASAQALYYNPLINSNSIGTSNKLNDKADNGGSVKKSLNEKIVIDISSDDEEEGEIDMSDLENELKGSDNELEQRIVAIRETLESVSTSDLQESFDLLCFRLNNSIDSLWEVVLEDSGSDTDKLIKLAYGALSTLNNMFGSMSQKQQEQNKQSLSRLFFNVTSQTPPLFAVKEMNEMESVIKSLESGSPLPSLGDTDKQNIQNDDEDKTLMDSRKLETSSLESRVLSVETIKQSKIEKDEEIKTPRDFTKLETSSLEAITLSDETNKKSKIENDDKAKPSNDFMELEASSLGGGLQETNKQKKIENDDEEKMTMDVTKLETSCLKSKGLLGESNKQNNIENDDDTKMSKDFTKLELSSLKSGALLGETHKQSKIENDGEAKSSTGTKLETSSLGMRLLEETNVQTKIESNEEAKTYMDFTKLETSNQRGRRPVLPLLELLKDHEKDSLPSPTQNAPKIKPGGNAPPPAHEAEGVMSYYQTDALKVVSTYQQKFGHNSFNMSDLPSPTPLDDADNRVGDINGEVSSFSIVGANFKTVTAPTVSQSNISTLPQLSDSSLCAMNICSIESIKSTKNTVPLKSLSKSRDPSLRYASADIVASRVSDLNSVGGTTSSKKKKPTDELVLDDPILKRQKNGPTGFGTAAISFGTSNTSSLESILKEFDVNPAILVNPRKVEKVNNTSSSLESILKEFNVDPKILTNVMKMGEHKFVADPVENVKHVSSSNSGEISVTLPKSTKVQLKSVGILQPPTQAASTVPSSQPSQDVKPVNNQRGTISSYQEVSVAASQNAFGDVEHLFKGLDEKQKAALHKERARRIEEQKKMFAARKLCLVLDLDHTLLNSAKISEVDPVHGEKLKKKEQKHCKNPHRQLFRVPHMGMWTKLRPGIWNFLEKASKLFELHLCTMGNKMYATEMAKLLDPKGTLFCGRIISRGDDDGEPDASKTKDLEGVLGMESCVVIIDDTVQVWPHNKLNLITVERYIYFPCSRRQFGLSGPSLLEIGHDECLEAGTLASSLAVIERIHQNFFAHPSLEEADVRNILASEQKKILAGCRIVFSRVFPVGEANARRHPFWQTAEHFGAICTIQIDEQVTHVVANSLGTHKVKWAYSTGRFVVRPGWVEASALLYRRAKEQDFALKP